jgi:AGCS family alanine or glycine:cation symporter
MKSSYSTNLAIILGLCIAFILFLDNLEGIDEAINGLFAPVTEVVQSIVFYSFKAEVGGVETSVPIVVVWLILTAIILTFQFRFINFTGFREAIRLAFTKKVDRNAKGEVSHFQALTAALSGTVGLGNIAGVAVAISMGGPGATFWMVLAALFGMATKFVECSLGHKYRIVKKDGSTSGGAMYYLSRGLKEEGYPKLGKFLAYFFAVMCIGGAFGAGNMFQSNQAYLQFVNATGGETSFFYEKGWLFGVILSIVVGLVIIGGIKSIARVTEKVVPFMGGMYVFSALIIILSNYEKIVPAFGSILSGAFTPDAAYGGLLGVIVWGFIRATFSNEAGIGSAPIAYSAVKTKQSLSVGFVSLLEPFIDTVIICTMTALVIVITGVYQEGSGIQGVELTSAAFGSVNEWFPYILSIAVILFAFSTIVTWSYYGLKSWTYIVGDTERKANCFKILFCLSVIVGSSSTLTNVIGFSDAMIFAMAFPNVIGLFILSKKLIRDLKRDKKFGRKFST